MIFEKELQNDVDMINKSFFEGYDRLIKVNLSKLKCIDISEIYSAFFRKLKKWRGTAANFTGISEFLIFRTVYHMLGGDFEEVPPTNWDTGLVTFENARYILYQSKSISKNSKTYSPDISILDRTTRKPLAFIQIKLSLSNGEDQRKYEEKFINWVNTEYPDTKLLYLIYTRHSDETLVFFRELGVNVVSLEKNTILLTEVLKTVLPTTDSHTKVQDLIK